MEAGSERNLCVPILGEQLSIRQTARVLQAARQAGSSECVGRVGSSGSRQGGRVVGFSEVLRNLCLK